MTVIEKVPFSAYLFFMKLLFLSTTITLLVCFPGCRKDALPGATQTGANTFGCLVNGKKWIPDGSHGLFVSIPALSGGLERDAQGRFYFSLSARKDPSVMSKEEGSYDDMTLEASPPLHLGEYVFDSDCNDCSLYCPSDRLRLEVSGINGKCFSTNATFTGKVIFTRIDTAHHIVSGTFGFRAVSSSGEVITVTNGRFDIAN